MTSSTVDRSTVRITVLLVAAIAGFVFTSTAIVLLLSGQAAYRNTWELLQTAGRLTIGSVENEIRNHVKPAEKTAKYLRDLVANGEVDPNNLDEMQTLLKGTFAAAPQIGGIGFWDQNLRGFGILKFDDGHLKVIHTPASTDQQLNATINKARETGQMEWGSPGPGYGGSYVYVIAPLHRQGKYIGAIATGVKLDNLTAFVETVGRDVGMTGFILYGDKSVLAYPSLEASVHRPDADEGSRLPQIDQLDDSVLKKFMGTDVSATPSETDFEVREIENNGNDYLFLSRTSFEFGLVPWHIGVYAPIEDLNTQLRRLSVSVAVALLVLIASVLGAVLLARRIANPIRTLAVAAEQIGRFDLSDIPALPRSRIREIDDQAAAFNRMLDGLRWFETYVPKTLVNRLITGHQATAIQSEEMDLTVMFTDIVGFTPMAETMQPSAVAGMLNNHFEILENAIEAECGTLDKYIGDSVMAFWGAPNRQPDHAARACRAALRIAAALEEANRGQPDRPPIRIKIALHSGPLLVGNIGAPSRMNYTVIGDTVNTCSRIENLCRDFEDGRSTATILVSEDTAKQAQSAIDLKFVNVGCYEVKGRNESVSICRLENADSASPPLTLIRTRDPQREPLDHDMTKRRQSINMQLT